MEAWNVRPSKEREEGTGKRVCLVWHTHPSFLSSMPLISSHDMEKAGRNVRSAGHGELRREMGEEEMRWAGMAAAHKIAVQSESDVTLTAAASSAHTHSTA